MEYKTGREILNAVYTAQSEGYTRDQIKRLVDTAFDFSEMFNEELCDILVTQYYSENRGTKE